MIYEPEAETVPRERLQALQADRLRSLIGYVKERVPLYRERLADAEPGDFSSLDDLRRLPFTRKDDLRDTYPFGMFAVPRGEVSRIHASSGTTGKLTVGYTAADLELFAQVDARCLAMAGAEPGMTLHNAYGDVTSLSSEPCTCGRTLVRMGRIVGRADDMLIIRGVNVYPTQVEAALLQLREMTPNYRIVGQPHRHAGPGRGRGRGCPRARRRLHASQPRRARAPRDDRLLDRRRAAAARHGSRSEGGKLQCVLDRRK